jgi:hypothetical protein
VFGRGKGTNFARDQQNRHPGKDSTVASIESWEPGMLVVKTIFPRSVAPTLLMRPIKAVAEN